MAEEQNTNPGQETLPGLETKEEKARAPHKIFGKWIECIVSPKQAAQQGTTIFVKVNSYNFEIIPEKAVWLPEKIIKFIKTATTTVGFFDEDAVSPNGNATANNGKKGAHSTKEVRKYSVELVERD